MSMTLLAGLIVVSIILVVYSLWPRADEKDAAIKRRMAGRKAEIDTSSARQQAKDSVAKKVLEAVTPMAVRSSAAQDMDSMSKLRVKLAMAGFRSESSPMTFLASKTVVAVILGLASVAFVWANGYPMMTAAGIVMTAVGAGFLAPNLWLGSAIAKRQEQIRMGLPDTLDMLVISVESGLGLDAAFQRVGDEMSHVHPALADELQLVTIETQMGIPRSEALRNFTLRAGIDETKSLVAIINQTERFGTSIARALRNQSDALRVKRRQAAEERAQKTAVKLMAPLILFIFPAIMVVMAGPAALKVMDALSQTPGLL